MKITVKALFGILLVMLGMIALFGCEKKPGDVQKEVKQIPLISEGSSDYVIVRSDNGDENEKQAAMNLRNTISKRMGVSLRLTTDYVTSPEKTEEERNPLEILIGRTNRAGTEDLVKALEGKRYEFIIRVIDGKHLMISGYTSEGTLLGVNYFIEHYMNEEEKNLLIPDNLDVFGEYEYPVGKLTVQGNALDTYSICISAAASRAVKNAANAMQSYLWDATGTRLPIVTDDAEATTNEILIGQTKRKENLSVKNLSQEDYRIKTDGNTLVITGGSDRGVLYGVYGFLQDYVGWNYYTPTIEDCNHSKAIKVASLDVKVSPSFEWRELYTYSATDPLWCVKNGINGNLMRNIGNEYGGSIAWVGSQGHNLGQLAETGDKANPCLTSDAVYKTVLQNVKNYLLRAPDCKIVSVSQLDSAPYCQCTECRKYMREHGNTYSSLILNFVNRIAEGLEIEYPDVKVETLAYLETIAPPKNLKAHKNVIVRFCPITAVRSDAMSNSDSIANLGFCAQLKQWKDICKTVYVWDYTCGFQQQMLFVSNIFDLGDSIRYYSNAGVAGIMMQGFPRGDSPEFGELRTFLMARCMRNPKMSEKEYLSLIQKFLNAYYGAGWEKIYEYLQFMEKCTGKFHVAYNQTAFDSFDGKMFLNALKENTARWDDAETMAATEQQKENVRKTRVHFTYLTLELTYERDYTKGTAKTQKAYENDAKSFYEAVKEYEMWWKEVLKIPVSPDYTKSPSQWQ